MTELTEYLIELGRMLGVDTDTEGCVNPNLARSARIVLAIGELERKAAQSSEITAERDRLRGVLRAIRDTDADFVHTLQNMAGAALGKGDGDKGE